MERGAGIVVLAAALAVVAATAFRPSGIGGAAAPILVAGPPAIGDCITELAPAGPNYGPGRSVFDTYPQVRLGACGDDRYGEVVGIIDAPAQPVVTGDESNISTDDANVDTCLAATNDYLGATPIAALGVEWTPSLFVQWPVMASPSDLQHAVGQRWVACLVVLNSSETPRYTSTLRDAVHTGAARDQTGTCFDGTDNSVGYASDGCQRPHTSQLIAYAALNAQDMPREQVERSCRTALTSLTGMPDITAGGALTVLTSVHDSNGHLTDADPVDEEDSADCGLTSTDPNHTLNGGLIGLGFQPHSLDLNCHHRT